MCNLLRIRSRYFSHGARPVQGLKKESIEIDDRGGESSSLKLGGNHGSPALLSCSLSPDLFFQLFVRKLVSGDRVPRDSRHSKRSRKHTPKSRVRETY